MDSVGSGYKSICAPLFEKLSAMDYDIKVVGLMYQGQEHPYPFSIIPCSSLQNGEAIAINMIALWQPDIVIVALDLPLQAQYHARLSPMFQRQPNDPRPTIKYIAITPLENGPLTMTWAAPLINMDGVFFISELGKQEAHKAGVLKAEHLQVGVDTESFRLPFPEEKSRLRDGLGIPQDTFVVLTVADNQERKNLSAAFDIISQLKKKIDRPIKYILVTREQNQYGWKLRDLALYYGINKEYMCFERGIPREQLWGLYAIADAYLQTSKAEGLGLPVLDAMAVGVPVVATNTGAMTELLFDERGYLIEPEFTTVDVWGNSIRKFISVDEAVGVLSSLSLPNDNKKVVTLENALEYVKARTWNIPANQIDLKIKELFNERK